jgi:hypothetical protein
VNETKHTPGPWGLTEHTGPRDITCRRKHWQVSQTLGGQRGVAIVFGPEAGPNPTGANARLVAAAPDLLAALEAAQCSCSISERESGHITGCWMPDAIAAIAKVKS